MSDYWEDNNIEKPQQIVVCAACKLEDGLILCGARHWDMIMIRQAQAMGSIKHAPRAEQGFIDQFGDFLTREEAMQVVKASGQDFSITNNGGDIALFSEGLY